MSQKSLEMGRPLELVKESGCRKRSALTVGSPGGDWSREGTADDFATIPSTMNHHQEMMHRRSLFPSARRPKGAKEEQLEKFTEKIVVVGWRRDDNNNEDLKGSKKRAEKCPTNGSGESLGLGIGGSVRRKIP